MPFARFRRPFRVGALLAACLLLMGVGVQSASADGTRTINSYVTCSGGSIMYGFWIDYGAGWTDSALGASGYQVNASEKEVTYIIPSSATYVSLDTYCNSVGYIGPDTWEGYSATITPGTSTITANWVCDEIVENYYGQITIEHHCDASSLSYG